jgi:hypothetical protein
MSCGCMLEYNVGKEEKNLYLVACVGEKTKNYE